MYCNLVISRVVVKSAEVTGLLTGLPVKTTLFKKTGQFYIVSDKHLKLTVSHVSYICMNKTQCHSESLAILLYDYKKSSQ